MSYLVTVKAPNGNLDALRNFFTTHYSEWMSNGYVTWEKPNCPIKVVSNWWIDRDEYIQFDIADQDKAMLLLVQHG